MRARATIHVTVEVALNQPWSGTATMDEIYRVSKQNAEDAVRACMSRDGKIRILKSTIGTLTLSDATPLGDGTG